MIVPLAVGVAALMSTQFLAQPFVWRNWPIEDIAVAWGRIAGDRVIVALAISLSVVVSARITGRSPRAAAWSLGVAILLGSVAGDYGRSLIDPYGDHADAWSRFGRIMQWSVVAGAIMLIIRSWRATSADARAADEAQLGQIRARQAITQAQLETLRWQIEPHFLFNTLATIQSLGRTSPAQGLGLLSRLFDFITANVTSSEGDLSTLGAELDLARAYLDVCKARMGPRLTVDWNVDQALRAHPFPRYLLGTLVENAFKHGISPLAEDGRIVIAAARHGDQISISVSDTGQGLTEQFGTGTGLANLVARLRLRFGGSADFSLLPFSPRGTIATVRIPYQAGPTNG